MRAFSETNWVAELLTPSLPLHQLEDIYVSRALTLSLTLTVPLSLHQLEDIYVEFAAAAGSYRLVGPAQREALFHAQIPHGVPTQFLYLQVRVESSAS
jgi:hypothetical protein